MLEAEQHWNWNRRSSELLSW